MDPPTLTNCIERSVWSIPKPFLGSRSPPSSVQQLLDDLLTKSEYKVLSDKWGAQDRVELVDFWHQLDGQSDFGAEKRVHPGALALT